SSTVRTGGDLVRDLQSLAAQPPTDFQAVFPVSSAPDSNRTSAPGWLPGARVVGWMQENSIPPFGANERIVGAVTFKVNSRDRGAATNAAAARFVLIRDRAILGARKPIESLGFFWLSGSPERLPIEPPTRGVEVASISRQDQVYSFDGGKPSIE